MRQLRILTGGRGDPNLPYLHYYYPVKAFRKLGHRVDETGVYRAGYDFAFMQDNTRRTPRPSSAKYPVGHWATDCEHLWRKHKAGVCMRADVVFVDTYDWVEKYREFSKRVEWLPFACDPETHRETKAQEKYDIGFVGWVERQRVVWLNALRDAGFNLRVRSSRDPSVGQLTWPELCRFTGECKLVFNFSLCAGLNMRLYETLSMGKLLLTNRKGSEPDIFFRDGEHLAVYETPKELVEKAGYYLENEDERRRVAKAGQELVHEKHTYLDRMRFVIKTLLG